MYLINKTENKIEKVAEKSFSELGFKERDNLQEWIANNPECLGEDLLIIQKEFDGFNDTNERLGLHPLVWTDQVRAARQGFDGFDFLSNSVSYSSGGM